MTIFNQDRGEGVVELQGSKIHAADFRKSVRLRRILNYLLDGWEHYGRDIRNAVDCMALHSDIAELRHPKNGFEIQKIYHGKNENGRQLFAYRMTDADIKKYKQWIFNSV